MLLFCSAAQSVCSCVRKRDWVPLRAHLRERRRGGEGGREREGERDNCLTERRNETRENWETLEQYSTYPGAFPKKNRRFLANVARRRRCTDAQRCKRFTNWKSASNFHDSGHQLNNAWWGWWLGLKGNYASLLASLLTLLWAMCICYQWSWQERNPWSHG